MTAETKDQVQAAITAWQINQACAREMSFKTLAMSSTSRRAIAAASGITSAMRRAVLMSVARQIGMTGIVTV